MTAGIGGEAADDPHTDRKRDRQQQEDRQTVDGQRICELGRTRQHPEEEPRAPPDAEARASSEQRPLERTDDECCMFRVPTALVSEPRRNVCVLRLVFLGQLLVDVHRMLGGARRSVLGVDVPRPVQTAQFLEDERIVDLARPWFEPSRVVADLHELNQLVL